MSKKIDANSFWYIKHNPVSKEGVFPYLGHTISDDCEPNKIYKVYRPAKTLQDSVETWDNPPKPFIEDHEMLGEGFTAVDDRPVQGVIFNPVCENGVLYADIAVYSEDLKHSIESGKKELSLGYFCKYKKERGVYKGEVYDYVQTNMVGNHIALVDAGRCGSDVKVFDHKCTMDAMPINGEFVQDGESSPLKKTTENGNIELTNDEKENQMVDKRKFIDEIAAIAEKPISEFEGGEEEKFRTIVGLLEKSEYSKSESGKADDEDDTEKEKTEDKCGKDSDDDESEKAKKTEDALDKLLSAVKDMADDVKKLVAEKEKAQDEDDDEKKKSEDENDDDDDDDSDDEKKKSEDSAVFVLGADSAIKGDEALQEYLK